MKIPCTIMRGGTSKAIILRAADLPADLASRDRIVLRIFGSPDRRQIDGLAGADPLTSKLAVVGPPSRPDADIDYTFADVMISEPLVDFSGYCGNVTAAVAAYAVRNSYVGVPAGKSVEIRLHNTNTARIIKATVPVSDGTVVEEGDTVIAGVPGRGAAIHLDFADTGGSITGKLLPAGPLVRLGPRNLRASIVDAGNPMVFLAAEDFGVSATDGPAEIDARADLLTELAALRVEAAAHLGLVRDGMAISDSIPAVGLVRAAASYTGYSTREPIEAGRMDVWSREIFLGITHKAYGVSETVCTTAAALLPGTIVNELVRPGVAERAEVRIGHPNGIITARATVDLSASSPRLSSISVVRTARLLMEGHAYIPDQR